MPEEEGGGGASALPSLGGAAGPASLSAALSLLLLRLLLLPFARPPPLLPPRLGLVLAAPPLGGLRAEEGDGASRARVDTWTEASFSSPARALPNGGTTGLGP